MVCTRALVQRRGKPITCVARTRKIGLFSKARTMGAKNIWLFLLHSCFITFFPILNIDEYMEEILTKRLFEEMIQFVVKICNAEPQ